MTTMIGDFAPIMSASPRTFKEETMRNYLRLGVIVVVILAGATPAARGQGYGTDTQNVLMPASGGMAGVSLALPQDVPSAIFGNPATLSQFLGTQFSFGGGWVEGYPTVTRFGLRDPNDNFSATSRTEGFAGAGVGITQDLRSLGVPGAFGLGFSGTSGLGAEFRGQAPAGSIVNDFSSEYMVLGLNAGVGFDLTDRLSVGAAATLGTGFEQLGLVSNSAMVHDYAVRGTLGVDYKLTPENTVGAFYQSKESFQFPNAVFIGGAYRDIRLTQPDTFGMGLANTSLMGGNLLLAADVYYKLWGDAAGYSDIFVNQWAVAFGAQLTRGRMKYRLGYSYNSNPINHNAGSTFDGLPVLQDRIYLLQASETAAINQHRLTAGFGRQDFLFQGVDLDFFVGGMFNATDQFGPNTRASVGLYYVGLGLTWRFGLAHAAARTARNKWRPRTAVEVHVQAAAQALDVPAGVVHVVQTRVDVVDQEVDLRVDVPVETGSDVVLPAGLGA